MILVETTIWSDKGDWNCGWCEDSFILLLNSHWKKDHETILHDPSEVQLNERNEKSTKGLSLCQKIPYFSSGLVWWHFYSRYKIPAILNFWYWQKSFKEQSWQLHLATWFVSWYKGETYSEFLKYLSLCFRYSMLRQNPNAVLPKVLFCPWATPQRYLFLGSTRYNTIFCDLIR